MEHLIDSTSPDAELFEPVEEAIVSWERGLANAAGTIDEILRLQEELKAADEEEAAIIGGDSSQGEAAAGKKLVEIRSRKELKVVRLQKAKRSLGLTGPVLNLNPVQVAQLEGEAAELGAAIRASTEKETQIFRGGGGRGLAVTSGLAELRAERQAKADKLAMVRGQLSSHKDAFRAIPVDVEVRRQLGSLVSELIRRREAEADRLIDLLCVDHKSMVACGFRFAGYFRSVQEATRLRLVFPSDPSEARELVEEIRALWSVEPLAGLLRVCEQEQAVIAETEEAVF